ncbi:MAG: hypothetical protein R3C55_17655 [Parvularculaceae bacterium]
MTIRACRFRRSTTDLDQREYRRATIWGLSEGEFVWRPTDELVFNMNAAYLNTKFGDFSSFNPHDPTAGRTDVDLIADITNGSNCVVTRGATDPALVGTFIASPYSVCSSLAAAG